MVNHMEISGKFQVNEDKLKLPGLVFGESPRFHGNYQKLPYGRSTVYLGFIHGFTWEDLKFTYRTLWKFSIKSYRRNLNFSRRWSWGLFIGSGKGPGFYLRLPGNYQILPCKCLWKALLILMVNVKSMYGKLKRLIWKKSRP